MKKKIIKIHPKSVIRNIYVVTIKKILRKIYLFLDRRLYPRKLIIGDRNSTYFGPGYETIDWAFDCDHRINLLRSHKLPFKDNYVTSIYSSHVIEHLDDDSLLKLFEECYRVLKSGGIFRVCCPDMDYFIDSYLTEEKDAFYKWKYGLQRTWYEEVKYCVELFNISPRLLEPQNLLTLMFTGYSDLPNDGPIFEKEDVDTKLKELAREDFVKWCISKVDKNRVGGHINGFNSDKLQRFLKESGFVNIFSSKYRCSKNSEFNSDKFDLYLRKNISVYVEAIK
jgi:predicted SAM-dependent methyltransferase